MKRFAFLSLAALLAIAGCNRMPEATAKMVDAYDKAMNDQREYNYRPTLPAEAKAKAEVVHARKLINAMAAIPCSNEYPDFCTLAHKYGNQLRLGLDTDLRAVQTKNRTLLDQGGKVLLAADETEAELSKARHVIRQKYQR